MGLLFSVCKRSNYALKWANERVSDYLEDEYTCMEYSRRLEQRGIVLIMLQSNLCCINIFELRVFNYESNIK